MILAAFRSTPIRHEENPSRRSFISDEWVFFFISCVIIRDLPDTTRELPDMDFSRRNRKTMRG